MTTYTLTLREAETQLRALVKQTQSTHQPVVLTAEDTAEPVAILLESRTYELLQQREQQLFRLQLQQLVGSLDTTEEKWDEDKVRSGFVDSFPTGMVSLWDVCPENYRGLCAMLRMAAQRLSSDTLTPSKMKALRTGLELFRYQIPTDTAIEDCRQQLIQAGLPPSLIGDAELVQMYVDEL